MTKNELQAASMQVGDYKKFFIGYDEAYYGDFEEYLNSLENEYIIPNIKNKEAYYEGKEFRNVASVASGVIRIGKGGIITIGSVAIGTTATIKKSTGAGALVQELAISVSASGVVYGATTMHNGKNLTQVAWDKVVNGDNNGAGSSIKFGSDTKFTQKLSNQMSQRGWTESTVRDTVDRPYTTRISTNKATGNSATVYYNKSGGYVIIDDVTKAVVHVSDNINPSTWIPNSSIINPYRP